MDIELEDNEAGWVKWVDTLSGLFLSCLTFDSSERP